MCIYKAEYYQRMGYAFFGICNDSLITKDLPFCIYKFWLITKDFRARIYKLGAWWLKGCGRLGWCGLGGRFPSASSGQAPRQARDRLFDCASRWDRDASLRMTSGGGQGFSLWKQLKIVKISHPQTEPDLRVALRFASVSIIPCLSRGWARRYFFRQLRSLVVHAVGHVLRISLVGFLKVFKGSLRITTIQKGFRQVVLGNRIVQLSA